MPFIIAYLKLMLLPKRLMWRQKTSILACPITALLLLYFFLSLTVIDFFIDILSGVNKLNLCGLPEIAFPLTE